MARYTPEQETQMRTSYAENPDCIDALADSFGVSRRSIIAKLSSMGLYKRKGYRTKSGELPVKKATIAETLGKMLELHDFEVEQLEKLSKPLLRKLTDIYNERHTV
jgi:Zn-dependent peptidase ImmA (M78 family)